MAPYKYERLQKPGNGPGEFRLATLYHGSAEDDIRISINVHRIPTVNELELPKSPEGTAWQALSYTWGDLNDLEDITVVDAASGNAIGELAVTKSLSVALRHIRYVQLDRLIWVDALCIDQASHEVALKERAWQVRYMHHIYSRADGVIVWLGAEADDSGYALDLLHKLGSSMRVNWWTFDISTAGGDPTELMKRFRDSTYTSREQRALHSLLARSYFDRVWIKQEATLADEKGSSVVAGNFSIALEDFRKAIFWISGIGVDVRSPNAAQQLDRLTLAVNVCTRTYNNESQLLSTTRRSKCKDPRDRIYGQLGIMALKGRSRLANVVQVDYSSENTVKKTYVSFFQQYCQQYNSLRLLMQSGLSQSANECPSWAPDWRNDYPACLDLTTESATSHFLTAECQFRDLDKLEIVGKYATEISHVRVLQSESNWEVTNEWLKEIAMLMKDHFHPNHVPQCIERLARAVATYLYNPGTPMDVIQQTYEPFGTYFNVLYKTVMDEGWRLHDEVPLPRSYIDEQSSSRLESCIRWFKTQGAPFVFSPEGHIGVGPPGVELGDEIYAIIGCKSLMILRPSPSRETYQAVGACFMHGFNWGEALLGPLPDGYTVVQRFQSSGNGYYPYYANTKTNVESMWDPRIAWSELEAHPPMVNFIPIQAPPGEPFRVRPDSAYLKRHGVELQKLMLV